VYRLEWLAIAGVALTFIAFLIYNSRDGKINTAAWLLWVVGDVLEAGSYFVMTSEDVLKNAVPIAFAVGSAITFINSLVRGRFGVPDGKDQAVIAIDMSITFSWFQRYVDAAAANIMFVATELISFIPLYRGIHTGTETEHAMPFLLWAAADALFLAVVLSLPHTAEERIYPAVAGVAHLLVVACIGLRRSRIRAVR